MIHKIESLVSIGKFANYQAYGDVAFKKLTLLYADNGSGKTTVSSVFRSLSENRPERIVNRKTMNSTVAQSAKIIQRPIGGTDVSHIFNSSGWRLQYPNLEVFDIHFVDENIYSGSSFSEDHKKQLHEFVIGAQSVAIKQQIDQNKIDKVTSRGLQNTLELQIVQAVGHGLTQTSISPFLKITPNQAQNIDVKISAAATALVNANSNSVIQTLPLLSDQTAITHELDFEAIETDLEISMASLQDASLQHLLDQHTRDLAAHGVADPKGWLNIGFQYHVSKTSESDTSTCPFCKQFLPDPLNIIDAYSAVFDIVFNAFIGRLKSHLQRLTALNIELEIQRISNISAINSACGTSWTAHLPAGMDVPNAIIIEDAQSIREGLEQTIELVKQKIANPTTSIDTNPVTEFNLLVSGLNTRITSHNVEVANCNAIIQTFRSGIQTVPDAQLKLNTLTQIKKRFEPAVLSLCNQLQAERQNLRNLETAYTTLSQQQQAAAQAFLITYKDKINYYLGTVFKTPFSIDNVVHVAPQGRGTQNKINFRLTLNGHEVPFDSSRQNNVKDCLSEGDKSTIALAFFLSKLDIDPGKTDKILVFDDPLSSFDSNRRMYTVQLIKILLQQIKQVIVLSHNEHFLYELYKSVAASEKKTLRISQNYVTGTSSIEDFDLTKLVENDYFKHLKELEKFLERPDIQKKDTVLGWLRNVLEAHIRFKFYRQLRDIPASKQTFGNVITKLTSTTVTFRDPNKQQVIDLLNMINNISCKPHHGEPQPDYTALGVDPATMSETELCHFITDTIDLIDNRL